MGKRFASLLIISIFMITMVASAQEERDYEIVALDYEIIENNTVIRVDAVVRNNGTDAEDITELVVRVDDVEEPIFTGQIAPVLAGESITVNIIIPVDNLSPGSQQTLEISAGIDDIETEGSTIAEDNIDTLVIDVPVTGISTVLFGRTDNGVIIAGEEIPLMRFGLGVLASVAILMIFWVFSLVVRAIFSRPPRFGAWQPPYGVMPMYDQNTVEGRRWGWQQVAQNGLLLAPPTDGNIHPVKLLMSADGINLDNWKVTAMRLSQYDVYGRIARTQVIAEKKWVKRMNKVLKKRESLDEAKLQKMVRPITGAMVKQFTKKVNKKTAFLPIAFDMRWEGKHGDVRIIFELYQFSDRAWYRIDQWDPMMQVVSRSMQENYTFTIHGKENAEKMKDFRERLRDDLIWLLLESFRIEAVQEQITGQQPAVREQYNVPDTLSGMNPIQPDDKPLPAQGGGD